MVFIQLLCYIQINQVFHSMNIDCCQEWVFKTEMRSNAMAIFKDLFRILTDNLPSYSVCGLIFNIIMINICVLWIEEKTSVHNYYQKLLKYIFYKAFHSEQVDPLFFSFRSSFLEWYLFDFFFKIAKIWQFLINSGHKWPRLISSSGGKVDLLRSSF